MNIYEALLCASMISQVCSLIGRTQSAGVKGQLLCKGKPAAGVKVKLYDNDRGPDLDDLMDSGYTDANGMFTLSGTVDEITTIDPKLNIYHDCDDWLVGILSVAFQDKNKSDDNCCEQPLDVKRAGTIC
ncbi:unnamed protein product [Gongylonema pulchrum]|uniref:Transthyretin-like family protein n=1 Tax=Gongylonema pulchrum TaxID=637853 RepID=A0A183EEX8_9BILA|nr:unnamed protein product [Gongylonema pulchrum]